MVAAVTQRFVACLLADVEPAPASPARVRIRPLLGVRRFLATISGELVRNVMGWAPPVLVVDAKWRYRAVANRVPGVLARRFCPADGVGVCVVERAACGVAASQLRARRWWPFSRRCAGAADSGSRRE